MWFGHSEKVKWWELGTEKQGQSGRQILLNLVGYCGNFDFYSTWDGKSLEDLEEKGIVYIST